MNTQKKKYTTPEAEITPIVEPILAEVELGSGEGDNEQSAREFSNWEEEEEYQD